MEPLLTELSQPLLFCYVGLWSFRIELIKNIMLVNGLLRLTFK